MSCLDNGCARGRRRGALHAVPVASYSPAAPACAGFQDRQGIAMPALTSSRTLWKGAISFGLVHIPVTLHSATAENRMKFNLLNKSTMTRVGNQQVDKTSGEAMPREEDVKGC
jgi:hypothetical protein